MINYIGFESAVFDFGVDLDSSSSREIKVCCSYGMRYYSLSRNINILANGGSFGASESTSFTLP